MRKLLVAILLLSLVAAVTYAALPQRRANHPKVLVLGCDGMDPKLVRKLIDAGRLPNLARLEKQGGFRPLTTSIPPQSPVAWSNFITGAGPGVHGIFDFLHRRTDDPNMPVSPYFSTNMVKVLEEKKPLKVPYTQYQIPRDVVENELLRRGVPFWNYLDAAGVPVKMYRLPANFPPSESEQGHVCCLSGMGVPDALGNQGTCQHFSSELLRYNDKSGEGMRLRARYDAEKQAHVCEIQGPPNEMLRPSDDPKFDPIMTCKVLVYRDPERDVAKLVYVNPAPITGDATVELVLNAGQWSDWREIHFLKTPVGPGFKTMVRFYMQEVHPEIKLFVSPLNFVPTESAAVFSEPPDFAEEIGEAIGPYYTQGFAEAFNALKHELLNDEEYRVQSAEVLDDSLRMLDYALDSYEDGLLFFYFSSTDLQAHMFWWEGAAKHPVRSPENARKYMGVIEDLYTKIDAALGRCIERLGDDATIIVLSDHGFCNFRRVFDLNSWLKIEGYLVADGMLLGGTDWDQTRAYGFGLNGLYVNLKGRERSGIVDPAQRDSLLDEIAAKLLTIRDADGTQVIRRVYRAEEWYQGPETKNAPDLIIGYERGYRASWNTPLGDYFSDDFLRDNDKAWSADHCIAHDAVPGILFCNRPIMAAEPALIDLAPTILSLYRLGRPQTMTGQVVISK